MLKQSKSTRLWGQPRAYLGVPGAITCKAKKAKRGKRYYLLIVLKLNEILIYKKNSEITY